MLDISRDKVPTTASLHAVIDRLASLKINQVQLYSEHTFAYRGHPEVHGAASPLDAEEIRQLDAFCRARHVELVPNQNCLGHMNRWLSHDRYRSLAVAPEGFVDPFGITRAPMTIDPSHPGSLALVRELLAELLPLFSSRRVHVGLDEAWELPSERIDDFLAWVATLRALPELAGREMLMWGDMVSGHAERVASLPDGVTVCEWGYDDWHPFDERCAVLAGASVPFWVAPGTSSWMSILGRSTNARITCRRAAAAALAHGASGYLNTDWGDLGHLQQWVISEPGLAYGAAVSWCLETNGDVDLGPALSAHVFRDPTGRLAGAVLALGDAHRLITPQFPNMSALVMNLYYPQLPVGRGLTAGLTTEELDAVDDCLESARRAAHDARPGRGDAAWLIDEVLFSIDLVSLLTKDARARLRGDGYLSSVAADERGRLGGELDPLLERYCTLWLRRNRAGGLDDSLTWLQNLQSAYASGRPDPRLGRYLAPCRRRSRLVSHTPGAGRARGHLWRDSDHAGAAREASSRGLFAVLVLGVLLLVVGVVAIPRAVARDPRRRRVEPAARAQLRRHVALSFELSIVCMVVLLLIPARSHLRARDRRTVRDTQNAKKPLPRGKRLLDVGTGKSPLRRRGHLPQAQLGDPTDLYLGHGKARLTRELPSCGHRPGKPCSALSFMMPAVYETPWRPPNDAAKDRPEFISASHQRVLDGARPGRGARGACPAGECRIRPASRRAVPAARA